MLLGHGAKSERLSRATDVLQRSEPLYGAISVIALQTVQSCVPIGRGEKF